MQKPALINILSWTYLIIFAIFVKLIVILHTIPKPFLDVLRMPTFIRAAEPFLGFPYDPSLRVYQITLLTYIAITLVDGVSLLFFSSRFMKKLSAYSSLAGFTLMAAVFMYFLYSFFVIGLEWTLLATAAIYLGVSLALMMLDLITFIVDEELITHLGVKKTGGKKG